MNEVLVPTVPTRRWLGISGSRCPKFFLDVMYEKECFREVSDVSVKGLD